MSQFSLALNIKSIPRWCAYDFFASWSTWQESWQTRLNSRETQNTWGSWFLRLDRLEKREAFHFSGREKRTKTGHLSSANSTQIPRVKKKKQQTTLTSQEAAGIKYHLTDVASRTKIAQEWISAEHKEKIGNGINCSLL